MYSSRTTTLEGDKEAQELRGWGVSPCPAPGHLAHTKKERRSFCCNLQACLKWEGRGKSKSIVLRDRKSLKPVAAVIPSFLRYLCPFI